MKAKKQNKEQQQLNGGFCERILQFYNKLTPEGKAACLFYEKLLFANVELRSSQTHSLKNIIDDIIREGATTTNDPDASFMVDCSNLLEAVAESH